VNSLRTRRIQTDPNRDVHDRDVIKCLWYALIDADLGLARRGATGAPKRGIESGGDAVVSVTSHSTSG
jgi:hypothetical protein